MQLVVPPVVVLAVVDVMPPVPLVVVLAPLVLLAPLVPLVTLAVPVTLLVVGPADVFELELPAASEGPEVCVLFAPVSEVAGSLLLQARELALKKHAIPSGYHDRLIFIQDSSVIRTRSTPELEPDRS